MNWEDTTSYSRGGDREPRVWSLKCGKLSISVHRHIHYDKDVWLLSCDPFYHLRQLITKDIEVAKTQAVELVSKCLKESLESLEKILDNKTKEE